MQVRIALHPLLILAALSIALPATGCQWYESLRGEGFPQSNSAAGPSMRGNDPAAAPSGFFTDRRSDQIERNLGGGF